MRDDPQLLQRRLSAFVRQHGTAKQLAERIECDVRTAENIRQGHWPIARHWLGLLRAFGDDLTEAVFHPERAVERLEREVQELEAAAARARAELRQVEGSDPRLPKAVAPNEDRAAGLNGRSYAPRDQHPPT
jgi:hypothetical protein